MDTTEKGVVVLLSKPALEFVREVRRKLDIDSAYLDTHEEELRKQVSRFLLDAGLFWDPTIMNREAINLLKEATRHLRLIEK